jgi:Flp pilus assembly pilin Flp
MQGLIARFYRLSTSVAGATVIEYAFIASIISIAAVALWTTIGTWLASVFSTVAGAL